MITELDAAMRPGHLLIMASDGIAADYLDGLDFAASADVLANPEMTDLFFGGTPTAAPPEAPAQA